MRLRTVIECEKLGFCRTHLYGDIYSSPGITLAQRQLFMVAFLAEAHMHEELFGHAYAVGMLPSILCCVTHTDC